MSTIHNVKEVFLKYREEKNKLFCRSSRANKAAASQCVWSAGAQIKWRTGCCPETQQCVGVDVWQGSASQKTLRLHQQHFWADLSRPLTYEVPLPVGYIGRDVHVHHLEVQQPAVVSPGAKLQIALLHIERKPAHVNITGALQDACGQAPLMGFTSALQLYGPTPKKTLCFIFTVGTKMMQINLLKGILNGWDWDDNLVGCTGRLL